jgi:hypothetical protein
VDNGLMGMRGIGGRVLGQGISNFDIGFLVFGLF